MNAKGMGIGQVFVFIIAALSFALIMIFGYKAIHDFVTKGEQVQFFQFKTELENSIKQIYTEYGAVRIIAFGPIPSQYKQICFVDFDAPYNKNLCSSDQIACGLWESSSGFDQVDENIFLKPVAPAQVKSGARIKMDEGFLCLPVNEGTFKLGMEGKGDHTYLYKP